MRNNLCFLPTFNDIPERIPTLEDGWEF